MADLEKEDGTIADDNEEKAGLLNNYLSSVFTIDEVQCMPGKPQLIFEQLLNDFL